MEIVQDVLHWQSVKSSSNREFRTPQSKPSAQDTARATEDKEALQRMQRRLEEQHKRLLEEQNTTRRQAAMLKLHQRSPAQPKSLVKLLLESCGRLMKLRLQAKSSRNAKDCRPQERASVSGVEGKKVSSLTEKLRTAMPGGMLTVLHELNTRSVTVNEEKTTGPENLMVQVVKVMLTNTADIPPTLVDFLGVYMARLDLGLPENTNSVKNRSRKWSQFGLKKSQRDFLRGMTQLRLFHFTTVLPLAFFKGRVGANGAELYDAMYTLFLSQSEEVRKNPRKGKEFHDAGVKVIQDVLEPYVEWSKTHKGDVLDFLIAPEAGNVDFDPLGPEVLLHLCIQLGGCSDANFEVSLSFSLSLLSLSLSCLFLSLDPLSLVLTLSYSLSHPLFSLSLSFALSSSLLSLAHDHSLSLSLTLTLSLSLALYRSLTLSLSLTLSSLTRCQSRLTSLLLT